MIAGPSMCGKTTFIMECLQYVDAVFTTKFHTITYYLPKEAAYSKDSLAPKLRTHFPSIRIEYGLPQPSDAFTNPLPKLWIIDDQMKEISNSPELEKVFTRDSHHENVTLMFTVSNARSSASLKKCWTKFAFIFKYFPGTKLFREQPHHCKTSSVHGSFRVSAKQPLDESYFSKTRT